jgi:membrane protein implicated in regulation of membrane protease activity
MTVFLQQVEFWHWWVLGVVLLILEVFAPGAFFLWLALAAGIVGLVVMMIPAMAWEAQLLLFALLSVASFLVGRLWLRRHPIETDLPTLNRRGEQYVGRVFTLDEAVVNGTGKIRVDDTTWKIRGDDCAAGARVRVTGVDGTVLLIERAG